MEEGDAVSLSGRRVNMKSGEEGEVVSSDIAAWRKNKKERKSPRKGPLGPVWYVKKI